MIGNNAVTSLTVGRRVENPEMLVRIQHMCAVITYGRVAQLAEQSLDKGKVLV